MRFIASFICCTLYAIFTIIVALPHSLFLYDINFAWSNFPGLFLRMEEFCIAPHERSSHFVGLFFIDRQLTVKTVKIWTPQIFPVVWYRSTLLCLYIQICLTESSSKLFNAYPVTFALCLRLKTTLPPEGHFSVGGTLDHFKWSSKIYYLLLLIAVWRKCSWMICVCVSVCMCVFVTDNYIILCLRCKFFLYCQVKVY